MFGFLTFTRPNTSSGVGGDSGGAGGSCLRRPCLRIGFGRARKAVRGDTSKKFRRLGDADADDDDDDDGDNGDEYDVGVGQRGRLHQRGRYHDPDELNAYEYDDEFDVHVASASMATTAPPVTAQSVRMSDGRIELRLNPTADASTAKNAAKSLVSTISSPIVRRLAHFKRQLMMTSAGDGGVMRMQLLNETAAAAVPANQQSESSGAGGAASRSPVRMVTTYDASNQKALRAHKRSFITSILSGEGVVDFAPNAPALVKMQRIRRTNEVENKRDDDEEEEDEDEEEDDDDEQHDGKENGQMRLDTNPLADLELDYDAELRTVEDR